MRISTPAEQLFFTTALVSATDGKRSWSGTAFLYTVDTTKGRVPLLVTNRHVLEGCSQVTVRMAAGNSDGAPQFYRTLSPDLEPTKSSLEALDAIEDVVFIGYPAGLSDNVNFTPIVRRATTATPPELDYCGLPAFLIDGSVFPGSSGSPVLILNNGARGTRDGAVVFGQRVPLLGIVAAVHQRQVQGPVVELPATHVALVPETLDLGIVFRAEAIDECVDLLLAVNGASRTGGAAA